MDVNMSEAGYDENWIDLDEQIFLFFDMPSDLRLCRSI
jgi:hypothetical protein